MRSLVFFFFFFWGVMLPFTQSAEGRMRSEVIPGEWLVKVRPDCAPSFLLEVGVQGAETAPLGDQGDWYSIHGATQAGVARPMTLFQGASCVEAMEPNRRFWIQFPETRPVSVDQGSASLFASLLPQDPGFMNQWGFRNTGDNEPTYWGGHVERPGVPGVDVNILKAWELNQGSQNSNDIKIAVIDSGIDYRHLDLAPNVWREAGRDFSGREVGNDPIDEVGHGTHCAGTIGAAHDSQGIAGLMKQVRIIPIKVLDKFGMGTTEGGVRGIEYARSLGVHVMSNSWGGGEYSKAMEDAIAASTAQGIAFVAAAGNFGLDNAGKDPTYPANYPGVITVASHDTRGRLSFFSNYSPTLVEIAAPGESVVSTYINGEYHIAMGTSMAAPFVSGAIGLLVAQEGRMEVHSIVERLRATAVPMRVLESKVVSGGRLDIYNLLSNTRPVLAKPDERQEWIDFPLSTPFETAHPYAKADLMERTFQIPGARFIRAVISVFDIDQYGDLLEVVEPVSDGKVQGIFGQGKDRVTTHMEGETFKLRFSSDPFAGPDGNWGFRIERLQYQKSLR